MQRSVIQLAVLSALALLLAVPCHGQPSLFGQGVTMNPAETMYGATVNLTVTFRVEGAPISFYSHQLAVRKLGETLPPPPSVAGAVPTTFTVGTHQLTISWTIPRAEEFKWPGASIMSREYRFEIVWGRDRQVLLRDVRLASPAPLKLAYTGWGMRVFPAPSVSGGPSERREPPLEILRSRFKDGGRSVEFYIHKPGTGFAVGVRWEIAAWIADRWQHIATGTIERIDAGRDTLVSRGGFPPTADKAQIKIVSPAPEISAVLTQSTIDLNPSNCHVRMSDRGGVVDVGLGISNFGEREAGQFLWEIRKYRGNIWIPFHSQRVDSIRAGGRYAQGSIFIRSGDIQRKEPLQIVVDTENAIRESNEGNNVCEVTWGSDY